MKINRSGRFQSSSIGRSSLKVGKSGSTQASEGLGAGASSKGSISLSASAGFIQELRESVSPQSTSDEIRPEAVAAAKKDIEEGTLGSGKDMSQAVTALLIEL